jgi:hypothetical protein
MAPRSTSPGAIASSQATEAAEALSPICTASSIVPSAQIQETYRAHAVSLSWGRRFRRCLGNSMCVMYAQ